MLPGIRLFTLTSNTVLAVILAMLASCSTPSNIATQNSLSTEDRDAPVVLIALQDNSGALASATKEPPTPQPTPMQDGLSILQSRCTGCHDIEWYAHIQKSPAEWEMVLDQMVALGVSLTDMEGDILLDYLAFASKP